MKVRGLKYKVMALLLLLGMYSCTTSDDIFHETDGEKILLTFSVISDSRTTRAMNDMQENQIDEIDVLVFKGNHFYYRAEGGNITNDGPPEAPYQRKIFQTELLTDNTKNNCLVILANAKKELKQAEEKGLLHGTKENVLKNIVFENMTTDGKWPANFNGSNTMRPIPMSGESGLIRIHAGLGAEFAANPILLYRSLARMDVMVGERVNNFELTHVYVYRYNRRGCVAIGANPSWREHPYFPGEMRVTNVSLPDDPLTQVKEDGYLEYNLLNDPTSSVSSIYLLESERAEINDYKNATCLIVGGRYEGGDITYYRIELEIIWTINDSGPGPPGWSEVIIEAGPAGFVGGGWIFARILRNHIYEVTIDKVTGPGKPTKEAARGEQEVMNMSIVVRPVSWWNKTIDVEL